MLNKENILSYFDEKPSDWAGLNNSKIEYGIITNDDEKASIELEKIAVQIGIDNIKAYTNVEKVKNIRTKDDKTYFWIKPNMSARGYRFKNIYLDLNITNEEFYEIVLPICYAVSKKNVKFI